MCVCAGVEGRKKRMKKMLLFSFLASADDDSVLTLPCSKIE